ncbi:MAG: TonB-dependent receptor [Cyclobacteriaceae bacterium]
MSGNIRYRYLGERAANESNALQAEGYFLVDASLNYSRPKREIGFSIENLFNEEWNETQFETESRLLDETDAVSEIHFTTGTPFSSNSQVNSSFDIGSKKGSFLIRSFFSWNPITLSRQ